jgi:hypothetical protein
LLRASTTRISSILFSPQIPVAARGDQGIHDARGARGIGDSAECPAEECDGRGCGTVAQAEVHRRCRRSMCAISARPRVSIESTADRLMCLGRGISAINSCEVDSWESHRCRLSSCCTVLRVVSARSSRFGLGRFRIGRCCMRSRAPAPLFGTATGCALPHHHG